MSKRASQSQSTGVGKRKKKIEACPNPLFVQWLSEWKQEAETKGTRMQFTYAKALKSLQKFPLPLKTGKDCKILEFFGDTLCKMLDDKLAKHMAGEGTTEIPRVQHVALPSEPNAQVTLPREPKAQQNKLSSQPNDFSSFSVPPPPPEPNQVNAAKTARRKSGEYIPSYRSGGYAVLVTLLHESQGQDSVGYMTKMNLMEAAQPLSDTSFTVPTRGSHYTAWSSVSTLIRKGLVVKRSNPAKYSLTESGVQLARRLSSTSFSIASSSTPLHVIGDSTNVTDQADVDCYLNTGLDKASLSDSDYSIKDNRVDSFRPTGSLLQSVDSTGGVHSDVDGENSVFVLKPGRFDIVLVVDNAEHYGVGSDKQNLLPELIKNGIDCEVKKLHVGDFLWIARERVAPLPGQLALPTAREIVLDYIIERKRMDDLATSVVDGRFKEQKFRLKNCGLRNTIYLIEEYRSSKNLSIKEDALEQCIANTQVIDGFFVKRTKDMKESVAYLTLMTRYLQSIYKNKTLRACSYGDIKANTQEFFNESQLLTFKEFNQAAVKSKAMTVQELFGKQLLQLGGLSSDKVLKILEMYDTPRSLFRAFDSCITSEDKKRLIEHLKYGQNKRKIGPHLSKLLFQLYCEERLV